jgi:hypothetical protein
MAKIVETKHAYVVEGGGRSQWDSLSYMLPMIMQRITQNNRMQEQRKAAAARLMMDWYKLDPEVQMSIAKLSPENIPGLETLQEAGMPINWGDPSAGPPVSQTFPPEFGPMKPQYALPISAVSEQDRLAQELKQSQIAHEQQQFSTEQVETAIKEAELEKRQNELTDEAEWYQSLSGVPNMPGALNKFMVRCSKNTDFNAQDCVSLASRAVLSVRADSETARGGRGGRQGDAISELENTFGVGAHARAMKINDFFNTCAIERGLSIGVCTSLTEITEQVLNGTLEGGFQEAYSQALNLDPTGGAAQFMQTYTQRRIEHNAALLAHDINAFNYKRDQDLKTSAQELRDIVPGMSGIDARLMAEWIRNNPGKQLKDMANTPDDPCGEMVYKCADVINLINEDLQLNADESFLSQRNRRVMNRYKRAFGEDHAVLVDMIKDMSQMCNLTTFRLDDTPPDKPGGGQYSRNTCADLLVAGVSEYVTKRVQVMLDGVPAGAPPSEDGAGIVDAGIGMIAMLGQAFGAVNDVTYGAQIENLHRNMDRWQPPGSPSVIPGPSPDPGPELGSPEAPPSDPVSRREALERANRQMGMPGDRMDSATIEALVESGYETATRYPSSRERRIGDITISIDPDAEPPSPDAKAVMMQSAADSWMAQYSPEQKAAFYSGVREMAGIGGEGPLDFTPEFAETLYKTLQANKDKLLPNMRDTTLSQDEINTAVFRDMPVASPTTVREQEAKVFAFMEKKMNEFMNIATPESQENMLQLTSAYEAWKAKEIDFSTFMRRIGAEGYR